jgi:hypothetical protein
VEHDHRAFLFWPATDTAVLPVQDWQTPRAGAAVVTVSADELARSGFVAHPAPGAAGGVGLGSEPMPGPEADIARPGGTADPVQRSIVIGDRLVTLATRSVVVSDLETLEQLGVARF